MEDAVAQILAQWKQVRPDLDVSVMGIVGRLSRVTAIIDAGLEENFANHGLDRASFDVLATLIRSGEPNQLTPAELKNSAMITSSAVAQRVNKLEKAGLVERTPNPDDGRGTLVTLTAAGRKAAENALPDHLATENQLLKALSAKEQQQLAQLLSKLIVANS